MKSTNLEVCEFYVKNKEFEFTSSLVYFAKHDLFVTSSTNLVLIWSLNSGKCERKIETNYGDVKEIGLMMMKWDENTIICGDCNHVESFNVVSGELVKSFEFGEKKFSDVVDLLKVNEDRFVVLADADRDDILYNGKIMIVSYSKGKLIKILLENYQENWWGDLGGSYDDDSDSRGIGICFNTVLRSSKARKNVFFMSTSSKNSNYDWRGKVRMIDLDEEKIIKNFSVEVTRTYYVTRQTIRDFVTFCRSTENRESEELLGILFRESYSDIIEIFNTKNGHLLRKFYTSRLMRDFRNREYTKNTLMNSLCCLQNRFLLVGDEKSCVEILNLNVLLSSKFGKDYENDQLVDENEIHNLEGEEISIKMVDDAFILKRTNITPKSEIDSFALDKFVRIRESHSNCEFLVISTEKSSEKENKLLQQIFRIKVRNPMFLNAQEMKDLNERLSFLFGDPNYNFPISIQLGGKGSVQNVPSLFLL